MPAPSLKIGEVAELAGVSRRTVDFYTNLGLITPVSRTSGNFRLYKPEAIDRIRLVRKLESQGLGLQEIAKAWATTEAEDPDKLIAEVDTQVHELRKSLAAIPEGGDSAGLLAALAAKLGELVQTALEITGGVPPPL